MICKPHRQLVLEASMARVVAVVRCGAEARDYAKRSSFLDDFKGVFLLTSCGERQEEQAR